MLIDSDVILKELHAGILTSKSCRQRARKCCSYTYVKYFDSQMDVLKSFEKWIKEEVKNANQKD